MRSRRRPVVGMKRSNGPVAGGELAARTKRLLRDDAGQIRNQFVCLVLQNLPLSASRALTWQAGASSGRLDQPVAMRAAKSARTPPLTHQRACGGAGQSSRQSNKIEMPKLKHAGQLASSRVEWPESWLLRECCCCCRCFRWPSEERATHQVAHMRARVFVCLCQPKEAEAKRHCAPSNRAGRWPLEISQPFE